MRTGGVSGSRARLVLRWTAASLVGSAAAGGVVFALADLFGMSRGGFFSFTLGAPLSFVLGFVVTLGWTLVAALPRFAALSVWVILAHAFGDTDGGRFRLLVGMVLWSLPEAVVLRLLGESGLFLLAWLVVLAGLYLPRVALRSLRPGVFS